mmetsp:Transcript_30706/g.73103  ORF Transcript_30706/g.73103 Transcript_30706/m.73103 type:complete len:243 (+) Transcript_30706:49-777(+)
MQVQQLSYNFLLKQSTLPGTFARRGYTKRLSQLRLRAGPIGEAQAVKKKLLQTIAESRKEGATRQRQERILEAVRELENQDEAITSPVSGRWTLVYSTKIGNALSTPWDRTFVQEATNRLYGVFFKFAPALAGSQETGASNVSNEQLVDLEAKRVDNIVEISLWRGLDARLTVRVWGEVEGGADSQELLRAAEGGRPVHAADARGGARGECGAVMPVHHSLHAAPYRHAALAPPGRKQRQRT